MILLTNCKLKISSVKRGPEGIVILIIQKSYFCSCLAVNAADAHQMVLQP